MTERAEAAAAERATLNRKKRSRTGHRAYLVIESGVSTEVKFLAAKTRVAPLQSQTIPRLE